MTQKGVTVHSDHESNAWPRGGKSFCVESNTWLSNVLWGPNIQFLWFPCHNSTIRSNCAYVIVPISKKLLVIRSQLAWAKYCKNQFLKHVKIYVNNIKHHWWAICNTSSRSPHGPVNIHWWTTVSSSLSKSLHDTVTILVWYLLVKSMPLFNNKCAVETPW